jgi:hypothetical protein
MTYYHVLLKLRDASDKVRCVFSDLTAKELEDKFLTPYRRGQRTLAGAEVIDTMAITSTQIVETNRLSDVERREIQEKSGREIEEINRSSDSIVLISIGRGHEPEDIEEAGTDVTASFIHAPPGQGQSNPAIEMFNNPWLVAVAGGVVVAAITAWLGW